MKIAILVGALLGSALAQFGSVPECAQPCVTDYTSGGLIAGCSGFDVGCICSNGSFLDGIACCLVSVCSQADQDAAVGFAQDLCKAYGVTNLPSAVVCSSTASSSASTATSSTATSATSSATVSAQTTQSSTAALTTTASSSSVSPSATGQTGGAIHKAVNVGAGIAGAIAAVVGML